MSTAPPPFRLLDPLPRGRMAIEASAGTGKTFTLAALATRYVAEAGISPSQLLVVTFTRAATTELRARIRDRFVEAAAHLASAAPPATSDPLLVHLAASSPAVVSERRLRLERAVTEFDAATIATIHGFAGQVLGTLGAAAGADPDLTLANDDWDLAREICADALAAAAVAGMAPEVLPKLKDLVAATNAVLGMPDLLVVPGPAEPGQAEADGILRELVERSVRQIHLQRRRNGTRSFADLLTHLRDALQGPGSGGAVAGLRDRFRVALIDEFQDTDPVQWAIFRTLFAEPGTALAPSPSLVLVGDPKQAIYAFRGANIHTYLEAVSGDADIRSLGTNYRSDGAALGALATFLRGATFGDGSIAFTPVEAGSAQADRRLVGAAGPLPALSLRLALDPDLNRTRGGQVVVGAAEAAIYADLVREVRGLLDAGRIPTDPDADGATDRPVRPSDIAVLVKNANEADAIHARLLEQGVPAVLRRGSSVLASPAATQWRWLLEAVALPSDPARARTFALSWFGGRSAAWVAAAADTDLADLQDRLHSWADELARGTVGDLLRRVWADTDVVATVLARPDGDRCLTDIEHIAELFQTEVASPRVGIAALQAVLDVDPDADPETEFDGNVASRRVESEAEAVQLMTVWVAKGLEFPITCCPTLWRQPKTDTPVVYQDPDLQQRAYDLAAGDRWPDPAQAKARKALANRERAGEDLRVLYVALTRAKHQTIVWWSRCIGAEKSALAKVLFARAGDGTIDPDQFTAPAIALPADAEAPAGLAPLVADAGEGRLAVATIGRPGPKPTPWMDPRKAPEDAALVAAELTREFDRSHRRWSFTAITAQADQAHPHDVDEPADEDVPGGADEQAPVDEPDGDEDHELDRAPADAGRATGAVSPLVWLPAGADFGTMVHAVLEHVDFTVPDLTAAISDEIGRQLSWRSFDLTPIRDGPPADDHLESGRALLVDGLRTAVESPLGPLFEGRRLRDLGRTDRLDELSFELHLGQAGHVATDRDIGRVLLDHLDPADPFRPWATELAAGAFGVDLAGHLTGSIDVVLRVQTPSGEPRFVIVDYKTNRLHERGRVPGPEDYAPARIAEAMAHHHYPLQALLYSVALHRYLRWRLPGYRPEVHLGGAAYLFLRGMAGPKVAVAGDVPHGVCSWPIPAGAVDALSALLDGQLLAEAPA